VWLASLGGVAVLLIAAAAVLLHALENPNELWVIVQSCVADQTRGHVLPTSCVAVDTKHKVAILRSIGGRWQFLAVPTMRITGIEDPQVLNPKTPNYWALAWSAANRFLPSAATRNRANVALAINSVPGRSQNQLHIHIACIDPDVMRQLDDHAREITTTWSAPLLPYGNTRYRVLRVESPTLDATNPFLLLLKLPGAPQHMGLQTLVVTGTFWDDGKPGFYILDDYAHDTDAGPDTGHGEDLLDENCRL
jgi:CDP-diacylglycerol pyrophosphatase